MDREGGRRKRRGEGNRRTADASRRVEKDPIEHRRRPRTRSSGGGPRGREQPTQCSPTRENIPCAECRLCSRVQMQNTDDIPRRVDDGGVGGSSSSGVVRQGLLPVTVVSSQLDAHAAVPKHVPLHVPLLVPAVAGEPDRGEHEVERALRVGREAREEEPRRRPGGEDAAQRVARSCRCRRGAERARGGGRGGSGGSDGGRGSEAGGAGDGRAGGGETDDVAGELSCEQLLPHTLELRGSAGGSAVLQGPHEVPSAGLDDAEPDPRKRKGERSIVSLPLSLLASLFPPDRERPPSELPGGRRCRVGCRMHPRDGARGPGPAQLREQAQRRQEPRLQQVQRRAARGRGRGRGRRRKRPASAINQPVEGVAERPEQSGGELEVCRSEATRSYLPEQGRGGGLGPLAAAAAAAGSFVFVNPAAAREQRGPDRPREAEGDCRKEVPVVCSGDRGERRAGDGLGLPRGRDREDAEAAGKKIFLKIFFFFLERDYFQAQLEENKKEKNSLPR